MIKKLFSVTILFLISAPFIFSQTDTTKKIKDYTEPHLNFNAGVILQRKLWGEVGLSYGTIVGAGSCGPDGRTLLGRFGMEFTLYNNKLIFAPKVGFDFNLAVFTIRNSLVFYHQDNIKDNRYVPAIVIAGDHLDISFGFNIPVTYSQLDFIPKTRFSIMAFF